MGLVSSAIRFMLLIFLFIIGANSFAMQPHFLNGTDHRMMSGRKLRTIPLSPPPGPVGAHPIHHNPPP
ncbi:hypothetical protein PanWU01x14_244950 [Parasponia andersonii]|uniref:CLAVATA3/ESR (CLE)-related protein n=1 Tax=Parasponia andersonii TaxID=3476 RepID=A0A2P5BEY2_PARAD|nr:hypothetical protein PanWU01x14_244950 [Parasponia andersonii]